MRQLATTQALLALLLLPLAAATAQTVPDGFLSELYVGGPYSGEPVAFTFLPDGRQFILERGSGGVRLAAVGAGTSVLLMYVPDVTWDLEQGLLGAAVDPAWPSRPYVYLYYTHVSGFSRLAMYTASGDLADPGSTSMTLANPFLLLSDIPDDEALHNGGTVRFGPDGMLYLSLGEDLTKCGAQDTTDLRGSILRLDVSAMPQAGSGPPAKADITPSGNPFPGPNANVQLIYAWGLRNPFRFTIDDSTGDLFIGDVGDVQFEEINVVSYAGGGGENFGWPIREGLGDPGYGHACGQGNPMTDPAFVYTHDAIFPNAVIAGPRVHPVAGSSVSLPPSYDGSVFFGDWGLGVIRRIIDTGSGWDLAPAVAGQPSAEDWVQGVNYITDLQQGPDGALYFMKHSTGRGLYRIVSSGGVDAGPDAAPAGSPFARVSPNPIGLGAGVFQWNLGATMDTEDRLSLRILDVRGRTVRRLANDLPVHGRIEWNGRDSRGQSLPTGVYLWRLEREDGRVAAAGKVSILR